MSSGSLTGVRILDFSQMMAGPWSTQMLGDLGADVIKIERPGSGDWERSLSSMGELLEGESPFFLGMNRNKRSLTLDLKQTKVKEIIYRLAEEADVVVENFRPGVLDRLGFGYEDLSKINPGLVYCSSTGYGSSGPYVKRPGQDLLLQGMSGLAEATGTRDQAPTPTGTSIVDESTAMMNVIGVLSALIHKQRTGKGQKVEANLLSTAISLQCQEAFATLNLHQSFERSESGIGAPWAGAPYGVYATKDGYMTIAMTPVPLLGEVLGLPELKKYEAPIDAFRDRDMIKEQIEFKTVEKTTKEWLEIMDECGIWCGPVNALADVLDDPQAIHNEIVQTMDHPKAGEIKTVGFPVNLSETPATYRMPPPLVGEHNNEILKSLGYSETDIADFASTGVTEQR